MKILLLLMLCSFMSVFAQDGTEKLAVYAFGASDSGINKAFGQKLLASIVHYGRYEEVADQEAFRNELARGNADGIAQITQAAQKYGADVVCVASLTEAFGVYSISVRLINIADDQVRGNGSIGRPITSFEDLEKVSDELARDLLQIREPAPSVPVEPAYVAPVYTQCENQLNFNKLQEEFTNQLKSCSSVLAMNMGLSAFNKQYAVNVDPANFMVQCVVDGLKKKLPGASEYVRVVENFVHNVLSAIPAGANREQKVLAAVAVGSMNMNSLMDELRSLAARDACVVYEPYEPLVKEKAATRDKDEESIVSFGLRGGINFSHLRAKHDFYGEGSYGSVLGWQLGMVLDIAASSWFHIQPGVMYIQKGTESGTSMTLHYFEFPLLASLKFSALRINAGPYLGLCASGLDEHGFDGRKQKVYDFGISAGFGFDIGWFYIGMFYDHGLTDIYDVNYLEFYNRTLGLNIGVNL